jgi:uncharacterized protein YhaN
LASDRYLNARRQLDSLSRHLDRSVDEAKALDMRLDAGGEPISRLVEHAEHEVSRLQNAAASRQRVDPKSPPTAPPSAKPAHDVELREARSQYNRLRQQWRDALTESGLPAHLSPRDVLTPSKSSVRRADVNRAEVDTGLNEQIQLLGERRRQQAERLRGWRDQCLGLFGELDQELSEDTVTGITHQLQDILRDHVRLRRRRQKLLRQTEYLRRKEARLTRTLERLQQTAPSSEDLPESQHSDSPTVDEQNDSGRIPTLTRRQERLRHDLQLLAERAEGSKQLASILTRNSRQLDCLRRQYKAQQKNQRARLEKMLRKRGRCEAHVKRLTDDRTGDRLRLQLSEVKERIARVSRMWRTCEVADRLLKHAVEERRGLSRCHDILADASSHLSRLTDGNLKRVRLDDLERVLRVEDCRGEQKLIERLDAADRAIVCLSLYLGRLRHLAGEGVKLPVFLDDVLLRADEHRVMSVCRLLHDVAEDGFQMLLLTSHGPLLATLAELDVPVATLQPYATAREPELPKRSTAGESVHEFSGPTLQERVSSQPTDATVSADSTYQVIGPIPLDQVGQQLRQILLPSTPVQQDANQPPDALANEVRQRGITPPQPDSRQSSGADRVSRVVASGQVRATDSAENSDNPTPSAPQASVDHGSREHSSDTKPRTSSDSPTPDWWPD